MENREKVLLIEDEKTMASFIAAILSHRGYDVIEAGTGEMGIHMAASYVPDMILLNLGLPDMDGINVLKRIREWSDAPIIIVSARQNEQEKVRALDAGANDYVTKPFGNDELLARIRASIRTYRRFAGEKRESVYVNGGLRVDYEKRAVSVDGVKIHLTPMEYKIVALLSQNAGKVLTHGHMLKHLWGPYASESQMLRVNVANIRRKIEPNPAAPRFIITEVGVGYRMADVGEAAYDKRASLGGM